MQEIKYNNVNTYKWIVLLILFQFICTAQTTDLIISGHRFEINIIKEPSDDGDPIETLQLFRINKAKPSKKLLSHITKEHTGDCNSESLEIGNYNR